MMYFDAVDEAIQALRESIQQKDRILEQLREAYIRRSIRQAEKNVPYHCGYLRGNSMYLHFNIKLEEATETLPGVGLPDKKEIK
ncbi:DUF5682 family protein [Mucilaginibacter lappiensis]|uniref:Uncharacterized protein n=1 Tax=Mucilaginibacter lappiensis TaxID=354630 RepID=A0A841JQC7_9SPHI|nr:hypothetical protein [Mucilaginibacter lappiensis]MBB6131816.1 hypothetical protein [Mucilaginibacter lappiensis]